MCVGTFVTATLPKFHLGYSTSNLPVSDVHVNLSFVRWLPSYVREAIKAFAVRAASSVKFNCQNNEKGVNSRQSAFSVAPTDHVGSR